MITQFTDPIRPPHALKIPIAQMPIEPDRLYKDPATKAGECMAALFFRRGDVKTSPHRVEIAIDTETTPKKVPIQGVPSTPLLRLGLVTGLGVRVGDWPGSAPRAAYRADLTITPESTQGVVTREDVQIIAPGAIESGNDKVWVKKLRDAGILSGENATDPAKGLYESDTREILMEQKADAISVSTPMSQGGNLSSAKKVLKLPELDARLNGAEGTVFAGSLTDQPLATSSRILLLVVTDALNSGMTFADADFHKLVNLGTPPVLMRVAQAEVALRNRGTGTPHLWALAPTGERTEEIPLTVQDGSVAARIDLGALRNGPTPYFEFVRTE